MLLTPSDLEAIWLTLKTATLTTVILALVGVPIAWWLARTRSRLKTPIATLVALPIVLPPSVLGLSLPARLPLMGSSLRPGTLSSTATGTSLGGVTGGCTVIVTVAVLLSPSLSVMV